jgi:hypothetical protein
MTGRSKSSRHARPTTGLRSREAIDPPPLESSDVTILSSLREFEEARAVAIARGQAAAAVSATMAKAKMVGLLNETGAAASGGTPAPKMSLNEAARRIAFLLCLAVRETPDEPGR